MRNYKAAVMLMSSVLFAVPSFADAVSVRPNLSYDYTTGSDNYYANSGSAELAVRWNEAWKSYFIYSLTGDSDYDMIHGITVRAKRYFEKDFNLRAGYTYSSGKLKGASNASASSSIDLKGTKYVGDHWEFALGYIYITGSLSSPETRTLMNINTGAIRLIQDELESNYSANAFRAASGYEFDGTLKDLVILFTLGATLNSSRTTTYSQTGEISYLLPYDISIAFASQWTEDTRDRKSNYLNFALSKRF